VFLYASDGGGPLHYCTAMSVQLLRKVRLRIGAGSAKPGPAIGQALGPLGLNMAEFCKQFNEQTKDFDKEIPVPVELSGNP
jgi:large subunit ribosomal protein L11